MLSQSTQTGVAGQDGHGRRRAENAQTLLAMATTELAQTPNTVASVPYGGASYGLINAGSGIWTHGQNFSCYVDFAANGGNAANAASFYQTLQDANAYYTDNLSSRKSRWPLVSASYTPAITPTRVDLTFLAQCPYGNSQKDHKTYADGSGRIIVISMTYTSPGGGANPVGTFVYHGTYGTANTMAMAQPSPLQEQ